MTAEIEGELIGPPVNLDTASEAELRGLPGIGPTLCARIVASRAVDGPFESVADLGRIQGVTPKLVAKLASRVVVGGVSRQGHLVPRTGTDVVLHWTRVPKPTSRRQPMRLLPPGRIANDDDAVELRDDEIVEVASDKAPRPASPRFEEPVHAPPRGPLVIEDLPEARAPWRRFVVAAAIAAAAAAMGMLYGTHGAGYAKQRDVQALGAELATDVQALKADRQDVRGRLEKLEPMGAEIPKAAAQIDAVRAQQEESEKALAESRATVRRLKREVGILRDAVEFARRKRLGQSQRRSVARDPMESSASRDLGQRAAVASSGARSR